MYCIDNSSLIHGWNEAYPPDIFPTLWDKIQNLVDTQVLVSTEEVLMEILAGDDELCIWAKKQTDFFLPLDNEIQLAVAEILVDPINSKVLDKKKVGKTEADIFVIATAKVYGLKVVSNEKYVQPIDVPNARKIGIPNVCQNLNIPHLTFLEFLKEQNWRF